MSVGLYSGVSGLALGTGLYRNVSGLWSGASGLLAGFDTNGVTPTLILDFVGPSTTGVSLTADFTAGTTGTYEAYALDASQPQAGFINIQVWS
jgi:hypothetical protein